MNERHVSEHGVIQVECEISLGPGRERYRDRSDEKRLNCCACSKRGPGKQLLEGETRVFTSCGGEWGPLSFFRVTRFARVTPDERRKLKRVSERSIRRPSLVSDFRERVLIKL